MTIAVVKEEAKIKIWVDILQHVNTVFELYKHVVVCPIPFFILPIFRFMNELR